MTIKILKDIFTLKAFEPKVADSRYSLKERLKGQPIALLNVGACGIKVAQGFFGKNLTIQDEHFFARGWARPLDLDDQVLAHLKKVAPNKVVAVSLGEKVSVTLASSNNTPFQANASVSQSLLLEHQCIEGRVHTKILDLITTKIEALGFAIARVQLTSINLINLALGHIDWASGTSQMVALFDQALVTIFKLTTGKIETLRSMLVNGEALKKGSEETEALEEIFDDVLHVQEAQDCELVVVSTETPSWEVVNKALPLLHRFKKITHINHEYIEWKILAHQ